MAHSVLTPSPTPTSQFPYTSTSHSSQLNPSFSSFARNRGAIAGLVIGGLISIVFAVIWLTLARRRHRISMNDVADPDPETPADGLRRPPLDDGDLNDDHHHPIPERYPPPPLPHPGPPPTTPLTSSSQTPL